MTFPKIKWHVERNMYSSGWYTIIAEVQLGTARYLESYSISQGEIGELCHISIAWPIIERMQNNILDVLQAEATQCSSRVSHVKATNNLEGANMSSATLSKMADYESAILSSEELVAEVKAFYGVSE